jgi:hypothetical protein
VLKINLSVTQPLYDASREYFDKTQSEGLALNHQ